MGAKNMKKFIITAYGAIVIGLLMISSATAVPKVNSDPLMDIVNDIEKNQKIIEENIAIKSLNLKTSESINLLIKKIKDTSSTLTLGGLIDLIIKIIQWLITLIQKLIPLISAIATLVNLIYNLISIIVSIYNLIMAIIEIINNIINPEPTI